MRERLIELYDKIGSECYYVNRTYDSIEKCNLSGVSFENGDLSVELTNKIGGKSDFFAREIFFELEDALDAIGWIALKGEKKKELWRQFILNRLEEDMGDF